MNLDIALTIGVLVAALVALVRDYLSPDTVLLGALVIVTIGGVVDLPTALAGFANPTLFALAGLYIIAAALRETGALERASHIVLGQPRGIRWILLRMCPSVTVYSAFLNNTPVVAMGIPSIRSWCRKHGLSPSYLLMPLSYASILGGICTLIGTSTNLVTHGLLQSHDLPGLGFFELAWVGVPAAILGLIYLVLISPFLLREREDILLAEKRERAELVEVAVAKDSPLVGQSIEGAGLMRVPGLVLTRISRGPGYEIAPVEATEHLHAGDHLFYKPTPNGASYRSDFKAYPGLYTTHTDIGREEAGEFHQVVIREGSSLIGSTLEDIRFPPRFGAAVTAIWRGGDRLEEPINQLTLRPGDTLMLDTRRGFRESHEDADEFYITTRVGGEEEEEEEDEPILANPGENRQMWLSVAVLVGVIVLITIEILHVALAGTLGGLLLIAMGVLNPGEAREAVDWTVLIVIGAALGLGQALEASGAAQIIAGGIVDITATYGPVAILGGIIVMTAIMTEVITNNGAVALMFPIALSVANTLGLDPRGFIIGVTLAASMSLLTPIGYQTNLMVYGPGNYRFTDFTRVGAPLQVVLWIVFTTIIPFVWGF